MGLFESGDEGEGEALLLPDHQHRFQVAFHAHRLQFHTTPVHVHGLTQDRAYLEYDGDGDFVGQLVVAEVVAAALGDDVGLTLPLLRRAQHLCREFALPPRQSNEGMMGEGRLRPTLKFFPIMMRFLESCSWMRMTRSVPRVMK